MDREDTWVDPLKRLINDHEHVSEFLDYMGEIKGLLQNQITRDQVEPVRKFLDQNVVEHFTFEEDVIFPAILSGGATTETGELIAELQGEHEVILKDVEEFRNLVSKDSFLLEGDLSPRMNALIQNIFDGLLSHSSLEDEKLLPIVKDNVGLFRKSDTA
jgi:iron-sulfur cluster repair protein YtfE (RIC family)